MANLIVLLYTRVLRQKVLLIGIMLVLTYSSLLQVPPPDDIQVPLPFIPERSVVFSTVLVEVELSLEPEFPPMQTPTNVFPIIDIISTGTVKKAKFQRAQRNTFGSHVAVRQFIEATEEDDTDQQCHTDLTEKHLPQIANFCRSRKFFPVLNEWRLRFYDEDALLSKGPGWMCAQKRPIDAFYRLVDSYRRGDTPFPDYLLVIDDDTFLNFEKVLPFVTHHYPSHEAYAVAGCLIRFDHAKFTIPYGGWGSIMSRKMLENWVTRIHCTNVTTSLSSNDAALWEKLVCRQVEQNFIGERVCFREGMSVLDLMHKYTTRHNYAQVDDWKGPGYCLHSDWVFGYFANVYGLAQHSSDDRFSDIPTDRFVGYNRSEWLPDERRIKNRHTGNCRHSNARCKFQNAHICHYVGPQRMYAVHRQIADGAPGHYRGYTIS